jgi:threonine/homoserine/homoserine lactone efflux protein
VSSPGQLLAFMALSFLIIVIPGPSVLFVIGRALAYGRRTAIASAVGNELGMLVLASLVAVGVGPVVQRSASIVAAIRLVGAAYLTYLGVRAWRERGRLAITEAHVEPRDPWRAIRDGFVVGVANPKAILFFTAILPGFVDPGRGHVTLQLFGLGLIFALIALASDSVWGLVASHARGWFGRSPRRLALVGGSGGLALIGLGVGSVVTGRRN